MIRILRILFGLQKNNLIYRWNSSSKAEQDKIDFIYDCENTISIENSSWMAEWIKDR